MKNRLLSLEFGAMLLFLIVLRYFHFGYYPPPLRRAARTLQKIASLAAAFEWLGGGRFSTSSQPLGSRNRAVCTHDSRQLGVSLARQPDRPPAARLGRSPTGRQRTLSACRLQGSIPLIIIIGSAVLRDTRTGTLQATDLGKSYDCKDLKRRERSGTFPLVRTAAPKNNS